MKININKMLDHQVKYDSWSFREDIKTDTLQFLIIYIIFVTSSNQLKPFTISKTFYFLQRHDRFFLKNLKKLILPLITCFKCDIECHTRLYTLRLVLSFSEKGCVITKNDYLSIFCLFQR